MTKITIFKSDRCSNCREIVPVIRRLAKKKGYQITVVDVEKCGRKCDSIKLVPTVMIDNRRVSFKKLKEILK